MRVIAVPVKPLEEAKRRLSRILSPAERAVLSLAMLEDVLDACQAPAGAIALHVEAGRNERLGAGAE